MRPFSPSTKPMFCRYTLSTLQNQLATTKQCFKPFIFTRFFYTNFNTNSISSSLIPFLLQMAKRMCKSVGCIQYLCYSVFSILRDRIKRLFFDVLLTLIYKFNSMLQILRNKAQSIFIQVIVVIIALVFIFWGVGTNMMGGSDAALVVNGEEVSFQQYQQAYDQAHQSLSDQFGGTVPKGMAEALGLKEQVVKQLVQAALLRQGGEKMGVRLSALEIQHTIQAMRQFEKNGVFDVELYNAILAANKLSPTKFEANMRHDMLAEKTARAIGDFSTGASDFEIQDLYDQVNDSVAVHYAVVSPKKYLDSVQIKEDGLATWYATVQNNYKTLPEIKLDYLAYNYDTIGTKIDIDDAAIEAYYNSHLAEFQSQEERHVRHILFEATPKDSADTHSKKKAQAEDVLKRARAGEDFATLAKQYSEDPSKSNGGDLGSFSKGTMVKAFDNAVFALELKAISNLTKTDFGYHIIKVEDIKPASTKTLAETKEQIVFILQKEQAQALAFQLSNNAYESIISTGSLAGYIQATPDAPFKTTDFFSKNSVPDELKNDAPFVEAAFALNKGELSSLIKTSSGYAILFAQDIKAPVTPALADVKDQVTKDYKQYLAQKRAREVADQLFKELHKDGSNFQALAQQQGLEVQTSAYLTRQETKSAFPSALIEQIFNLSPEKPLPAEVGIFDNDFYVFSYLGRKSHSGEMTAEQKERFLSGIVMNKQQMILSAWLAHQQGGVEIQRHPSL